MITLSVDQMCVLLNRSFSSYKQHCFTQTMCSKEDFLNWSDLDLDELLVEYTDDDFVPVTVPVNSSPSDDAAVDRNSIHHMFCVFGVCQMF